MGWAYLITPFVAWLMAGSLKFAINSLRARRLAFDLIGYGGLPSNHSAIVSSVAALIAIREGIDQPAFGVAVALGFIVILDATSLRRQVGRHAETLNALSPAGPRKPLRTRMGHSPLEIGAGIVTGVLCAFLVEQALQLASATLPL